MPLRWDTRALASLTKFSDARVYMDFANGVYFGRSPSDLSVTRAGTSLVPDASGALVSFGANTLRRVPGLGAWSEEARTNLILQSQTFNTTWGTGAASVTADQAVAPDGTTTGDQLTEDGTTASHGLSQSVSVATNAAYTFSIYAKPNSRTWLRIFVDDAGATNALEGYFNLSGAGALGTISSFGTGSGASATITQLPGGWYRCTLSGTPASASTGSVRVLLRLATGNAGGGSYAGNGSSNLYLWGAQLEAGAFATSYIPTTTVSVARGLDQISLASTAFSGVYAASSGGTIYCKYLTSLPATVNLNQYLLAVSDGTTNNRASIFRGSTSDAITFRVVTGGVATNPGSITYGGANAIARVALAYDQGSNQAIGCVNGVLGTAATPSALPVSPNVLTIGVNESVSGFNTDGSVLEIAYWPTRLPNATLQALTA